MEVVIIILFVILIILVLLLRNSLMERLDRLEQEITRLREEGRQSPASPLPPREPKVARESAPQAQRGIHKQHTDWEKFIGENLVSKIGIAVLVLAIGFFVKYAIDNNWIGPVGRVAIGVLCGGILIAIAHLLRDRYKAFSSVLVGGGLATLYFTIALAYHEYRLLGQTTAFVIMLLITAFSVLLAIFYNREELAIIALAGGFITPFLVSNARGDYAVLFTYLLILITGLLVIAYNKAWRLLNILAFGFTVVLYASWLISLPYDASSTTYRGGWAFATGFYLLFFVINMAHTIRNNKVFVAADFGILLTNTCLYFAASLYLIDQLGLGRYRGLYCAGMGIINLGASWLISRRKTVLLTGAALLYLAGGLEINRQISFYFLHTDLNLLYLTGYTYLFVLCFHRAVPLLEGTVSELPRIGAELLAAGVLLYLCSLPAVFKVQQAMLEGHLYERHFIAHWAGDLVVLAILYELIALQRTGGMKINPALFTWLICLIIVTMLSAEGQFMVNALFYSQDNGLDYLARVYDKTGLPILWGICSFIFMWLGMERKFRPLRIVSLALFTVTLAKLFFFDIRNIPVAGKIAAFFCLGVLLLVVSFMYQRLRKIIIEDQEKMSSPQRETHDHL